MTTNGEKLGILVGGGPAPGINSVISSVTIEAINSGFEVLGIVDGFQHLIEGSTEHVQPLTISDVSRIHFQGGSVLRTSRANPTRNEEHLEQVGRTLAGLGITRLVTIGGDDTAFGASEVARVSHASLRVVHVPKTIDNDLPLPGGMPTFGFETARQVGTEIVLNMMEDSRTTNRWYMVVVMGRTAGHLGAWHRQVRRRHRDHHPRGVLNAQPLAGPGVQGHGGGDSSSAGQWASSTACWSLQRASAAGWTRRSWPRCPAWK